MRSRPKLSLRMYCYFVLSIRRCCIKDQSGIWKNFSYFQNILYSEFQPKESKIFQSKSRTLNFYICSILFISFTVFICYIGYIGFTISVCLSICPLFDQPTHLLLPFFTPHRNTPTLPFSLSLHPPTHPQANKSFCHW